jgi:hypothetical protein
MIKCVGIHDTNFMYEKAYEILVDEPEGSDLTHTRNDNVKIDVNIRSVSICGMH